MNALILIGGKSTRMGTDKSVLNYHGKPQRAYLYDLLKNYCQNVYFSCREEQKFAENTIIDKHEMLGPLGGILSAFEHHSNHAWLVVACDMPFINDENIAILCQNRDKNAVATAFYNNETQAPDPLFTIYEPKAFPLLQAYVKAGNKSPKFFLQQEKVNLIKEKNTDFLTNVNTKESYEVIKSQIMA